MYRYRTPPKKSGIFNVQISDFHCTYFHAKPVLGLNFKVNIVFAKSREPTFRYLRSPDAFSCKSVVFFLFFSCSRRSFSSRHSFTFAWYWSTFYFIPFILCATFLFCSFFFLFAFPFLFFLLFPYFFFFLFFQSFFFFFSFFCSSFFLF